MRFFKFYEILKFFVFLDEVTKTKSLKVSLNNLFMYLFIF